MKIHRILVTTLFLASCGGGSTPTAVQAPQPEPISTGEEVEPVEDTEEEVEAPPPPRRFAARVELMPVKGTKLKPAVIAFSQVEGDDAIVAAEAPLAGLKAGTYKLIVHEDGECGKNATKAGAIWSTTASVTIDVIASKRAPAQLEETAVDLMLHGDDSVIGRTLVLHEEKKGKLAKAVACGPILALEEE